MIAHRRDAGYVLIRLKTVAVCGRLVSAASDDSCSAGRSVRALLSGPHSERIAVRRSVIDQSRQLAFEHALLQQALDQRHLSGADELI